MKYPFHTQSNAVVGETDQKLIAAIELPIQQIQEFCQKWQVTEFALFGSVLREDFRPDSDIDILVTFSSTAKRGLAETLQMHDELQVIFNREVDLIVKSAIKRSENWLRRKNILESAQVIYAI
jgi:uncharacterized protein